MATTGYELVKESIFKEANEVSERLGKEPSNPKLLGAWEALTSVMKASALFDEYNDLRKNNSDLSWDEIERKYPEDRSEMSEEREYTYVTHIKCGRYDYQWYDSCNGAFGVGIF